MWFWWMEAPALRVAVAQGKARLRQVPLTRTRFCGDASWKFQEDCFYSLWTCLKMHIHGVNLKRISAERPAGVTRLRFKSKLHKFASCKVCHLPTTPALSCSPLPRCCSRATPISKTASS